MWSLLSFSSSVQKLSNVYYYCQFNCTTTLAFEVPDYCIASHFPTVSSRIDFHQSRARSLVDHVPNRGHATAISEPEKVEHNRKIVLQNNIAYTVCMDFQLSSRIMRSQRKTRRRLEEKRLPLVRDGGRQEAHKDSNRGTMLTNDP